MKKLSKNQRAHILHLLVENVSMRAITRITGVSINTVSKLLVDAGEACIVYHDAHVVGIQGTRTVQCDELWSFVYAKERSIDYAEPWDKAGTVWTFTAIDADSKLLLSYLILRWSWFVGQSKGKLKVYSDWFLALDERTLPTARDDVKGIVGSSVGALVKCRSVMTGSTLPVMINHFATAVAVSPEGPERSGGAA